MQLKKQYHINTNPESLVTSKDIILQNGILTRLSEIVVADQAEFTE